MSVQPIAPTQVRSKFASLYVGDLIPDVTEKDLFDFFTTNQGPIPVFVKICVDHTTRRSLGYGYVNFQTTKDAECALETKNGDPINGRPCRIMFEQRDPVLRRSGLGNIYVGNLDPKVTAKELSDYFSSFGDILSSKVVLDENGKSKGYGFVHFENVEASEKAIKKAAGFKLMDSEITVSKHIPYRERQALKANSWTNVFVKNLSETVTEEQFKELLSKYGNITSICLRENTSLHPTSAPGESSNASEQQVPKKKFGFANFEKHEDAVRVTEGLNDTEFMGLKLYVSRAQSRRERMIELKRKFDKIKEEKRRQSSKLNLYVKNLEDNVDEEALKNVFSVFGKVRNVYIKRDSKNNSAGFGFVCFEDSGAADRAIQSLHNRPIEGSSKPLYVAHHQSREVRQSQRQLYSTGYPYPYPYPVSYLPYVQGAPRVLLSSAGQRPIAQQKRGVQQPKPNNIGIGLPFMNAGGPSYPRFPPQQIIPPNQIPPNQIPPNQIPPNQIPPNQIPPNQIPSIQERTHKPDDRISESIKV